MSAHTATHVEFAAMVARLAQKCAAWAADTLAVPASRDEPMPEGELNRFTRDVAWIMGMTPPERVRALDAELARALTALGVVLAQADAIRADARAAGFSDLAERVEGVSRVAYDALLAQRDGVPP